MELVLELESGKYKIIYNFNPVGSEKFVFKAKRYEQEWRDLSGDKLIMALIQKIEELIWICPGKTDAIRISHNTKD